MKQLLTISLISSVLFISSRIDAQQLPRFSQYYFNEYLVNPAMAGYDGRTIVNVTARKQWVGFSDNTPQTALVRTQTRILKKPYNIHNGRSGQKVLRKKTSGRVGLGAILYDDQNGAIHRTGAQFTYAYHIFIYNSQLSFGLTGSIFQYRISKEDAQLKNPEIDPLNGVIGKSTLVPDAGFGINYMKKNWHIGLSISQLFQSNLKIGHYAEFQTTDDLRLRRHYFILADYLFQFPSQPKWEIEPSTIINLNERLQFQGDLTLKAYYQRKYWFGISARTTSDLIVLGGLRYKNYYFGYSFDYGFNGISRYTHGSHEITISAKFGDTARRYRWLERY
ncbi:MAG: type IX secretion system membrane protein PorP/SprF [Bacteroidales bacterium]|nr:type IX secretion system membrane protein PorP/SprF [Bacteroidales bacterium]